MATKFETKKLSFRSAGIENVAVPLVPSRWYSCVGYLIMSDKFYHNQRCYHGKKNLGQNRL